MSGFEMFVTAGPLCHEIMRGVAVVVDEWTVDEEVSSSSFRLLSRSESL